MLVCGCGRWMHTEGVDERMDEAGREAWLVRSECLGCGLKVGLEGPPHAVVSLVDRIMWTDDAKYVLDRRLPHIQALYTEEIEEYVRSLEQRVVTLTVLEQARLGGAVSWEPEAERRLHNVPAPVRAMAKVELERTAAERGQASVTATLMDEVRARYFGLSGKE